MVSFYALFWVPCDNITAARFDFEYGRGKCFFSLICLCGAMKDALECGALQLLLTVSSYKH